MQQQCFNYARSWLSVSVHYCGSPPFQGSRPPRAGTVTRRDVDIWKDPPPHKQAVQTDSRNMLHHNAGTGKSRTCHHAPIEVAVLGVHHDVV